MDLKAIGNLRALIAAAIVVCVGGEFAIAQAYRQTNLVSDVPGFARALEEFDRAVPEIKRRLQNRIIQLERHYSPDELKQQGLQHLRESVATVESKATRGDVGCDQQVRGPASQSAHDSIALFLGHRHWQPWLLFPLALVLTSLWGNARTHVV